MAYIRTALVIMVTISFILPVFPKPQQNTETILEGVVLNKNTQRFLERAVVEVLGTEISVLTDANGRFRIPGLKPGKYDISVSYTGLGKMTKTITIGAEETASLNFELTNEAIYESGDDLTVQVSPLEGNADAINQQREAETQRTVVSIDAFIDQTTGNPGEFLKSVQGVQMDYSQNEPQRVRVRGFDPNLTTLTIDGNEIASAASSSTDRAVQVDQLSIASIDNVEVFKAPIPSMSANSIGGAVNFNTKSAFQQNGRSLSVQFGTNIDGNSGFKRYVGPGHGEKQFQRGVYPVGRFDYSESFFKNRVGVFFSVGHDYTNQLGSSITHNLTYGTQPALPNPVSLDNTTVRRGAMSFAPNRQLRRRSDVSLNTDFKFSDNIIGFLKASFTGYKSTNRNHGFTLTPGTLAAGSTVTDYTTTTGSAAQSISVFDKFTKSWQISPGIKIFKGPWRIDVSSGFSKSVNNYRNDDNFGALNITLTGVNWSMSTPLDTDTPTSITQTGGPDFYDLNNYRSNQGNLLSSGGVQLATQNGVVSTNFRQSWDYKQSFRVDVQRDFRWRFPFYLKGGISHNRNVREKNQPQKRWYWMGLDGVATADDITAAGIQLGRFAEPYAVTQQLSDFNLREPNYFSSTIFYQFWQANPQVLQENLAYSKQQEFVGYRFIDEKVFGYYGMANMTIKRLNVLAGIRVENTQIDAIGHRVLPASALPAGVNANSLAGIIATYRRAVSQSDYTSKPFPYLHLKYGILKNLQARFSYTEAIGRPNFTDVLPTITQNDTDQTVTANRAGLLPQRSRNFDVSLEYYTKTAGEFTFGWFNRDVKDYISSATLPLTPELLAELNLGSELANYQLITKQNLGFAKWSGYETAARLQFRDLSFLPKVFYGFEVFGNYTRLYKVEGDFGTLSASVPSVSKITTLANLVPKLANAGISYRSPEGRFFVNLITNYQSARFTENLPAITAAAQRLPRQEAYQFWNMEVSYKVNNSWKIMLVGRNLTGVRPAFSEVGIIRNRQQDSGPAFILAAKWTLFKKRD